MRTWDDSAVVRTRRARSIRVRGLYQYDSGSTRHATQFFAIWVVGTDKP